MKIILLDKIQRLGEIGDIVDVNSGYARNFLIPQKKAAFASDKNIAEVEAKKDELAAISADIAGHSTFGSSIADQGAPRQGGCVATPKWVRKGEGLHQGDVGRRTP